MDVYFTLYTVMVAQAQDKATVPNFTKISVERFC